MIVVICEKRDQASKVAEGLGFNYNSGSFFGFLSGKKAVITWASGHLISLVEPQEAKHDVSWSDPGSLLPLPKSPALKVIHRGGRGFKPKDYLKKIKDLLRNSDEVWIATDPDREGEGIGWNIVHHLKYKGLVKRVWLADSLEPGDVKKAFTNPLPGRQTMPLWRAQQARELADWLWQFLVRAFTYYGRGHALGEHLGQGKGSHGVVSLGRVQTPTLRLIVERDQSINNFVAKDHYLINGVFLQDLNLGYKPIIAEEIKQKNIEGVFWDEEKPLYTDKVLVTEFRARLRSVGEGKLTELQMKKVSNNPPTPFSLTQLQRHMSKKIKMTASQTQKVAEALYLSGLISYPRTEHGQLPIAMFNKDSIEPLLSNLSRFECFEKQSQYLLDLHVVNTHFTPACFTDKPMEHHGIIPTSKKPNFEEFGSLENNAKRVWSEVSQQFLQSLYPSAKLTQMDIAVTVNAVDLLGNTVSRFQSVFKRVDEPGWMASFAEVDRSLTLPTLQKGAMLSIRDIVVKPTKTKPPKHYTEDTLLSAMINAGREIDDEALSKILKNCKGIGTPATRSAIIETLITREYIKRTRGYLLSQPKGVDLIRCAPSELSQVVLTAIWESKLNEIATASNDSNAVNLRDDFISDQYDFITGIIKNSADKYNVILRSSNRNSTNPPTPNMIAFAKRILSVNDVSAPKELFENFEVCKKFLDDNPGPPTPKMLNSARSIAERKQILLPDEVKTSFLKCKKFLNYHLGSQ